MNIKCARPCQDVRYIVKGYGLRELIPEFCYAVACISINLCKSSTDKNVLVDGLDCVEDNVVGTRFWFECQIQRTVWAKASDVASDDTAYGIKISGNDDFIV